MTMPTTRFTPLQRARWYRPIRTGCALIPAVLVALIGSGQNLVLNPGFEIAPPCPIGTSSLCANWVNGNSLGSYDFLHECSSSVLSDVPSNTFGSQPAYSGQGYANIITWWSGSASYREYLSGSLSMPLVAGQAYEVGFHWSLPDLIRRAQDRVGMAFTATPPFTVGSEYYGAPGPPTLNASVETPAGLMLADAANWNLFTAVYVASGGEQHVTIGNFRSNAATNTIVANAGAIHSFASLYIDEVFVRPLTVLPVTLLGFGAERLKGDDVRLRWSTATEHGNAGFEVWRSMEADADYQQVGWVDGAGDSAQPLEYAMIDRNGSSAVSYYKLRQVDLSGRSVWSHAVAVEGASPLATLGMHPNPCNADVRIELPPSGPGTVLMIDASGRFVKQARKDGEAHSLEIGTDGMEPGIYTVLFRPDHGLQQATARLVVMRY